MPSVGCVGAFCNHPLSLPKGHCLPTPLDDTSLHPLSYMAKMLEVILRRIALFALLLMGTIPVLSTTAQPPEQYIVFMWHNAFYAQATLTGEVTSLGDVAAQFDSSLTIADSYSLATSPLASPAQDGYGFYHGVWSPDRTQFVYLELAPPHYRVHLQRVDGENRLLLEGQLNPQSAYLDPIGWTAEGEILLLSRPLLNHLPAIQLWRLNLSTQALTYDRFIPVERLSGRTALLPDGVTVFLGFHLGQGVGYLLDIPTQQVRTFTTSISQTTFPAGRGFEYYPVQVVGGFNADTLAAFTAHLQNNLIPFAAPPLPAPFLHWPLSDEYRHITCYTDSVWTTLNFDVTCPGLSATDRNYQGHQGTDVSYRPGGLPIGTQVYPAAAGTVVATHHDCVADDPSCNNSYGNIVLLEHILVADGVIQVWYTGYAHLKEVLAEDYAYLSDLTVPLGLSGATGIGGPHLHFEVRNTDTWIDPWDNRAGESLWIGTNIRPVALVGVEVTEVFEESSEGAATILATCTSIAGNNIRSGAGTMYEVVSKTVQDTSYPVLEIVLVEEGEARGDWYRVQFEGGEGWLWSGLLTCP